MSAIVLDLLTWDVMQQAFSIGLLMALPLSILSCFLVLKGWSLLGDAIAHAVLPGVVIAYILALPLGIGAFAAGMFCALATGFLKENSRVKEDSVMAVVFAGMFALGIVLYVSIESDVHLDHILFGNMLGLTWGLVASTALVALPVTALVLVLARDFALMLFDEQHARAIGLNTRLLNYILLALISLCVVAALSAVGIILSISLLIAPGAIAFLMTRRLSHMIAVAVLTAGLATIAGITLSYLIDSAPEPTIVVVLTAIFIAVFVGQALIRMPPERLR